MRVSVTMIEAYRRVMQTEYAKEEQLLAQVQGEQFIPSWQMSAGKAWDTLISHPRKSACQYGKDNRYSSEQEAKAARVARKDEDEWEFPCYECMCWHVGHNMSLKCDGFFFDDFAVDAARRHVGPGIWQVKNTIDVETAYGKATVVGVADHVNGLIVNENKAKFAATNPQEYEADLQWRFYFLIFKAKCFRYNLFDFRDPNKASGYCCLDDIVSFRLWPYHGLEQDCMLWLNRFLGWAHDRHLLHCLVPGVHQLNKSLA